MFLGTDIPFQVQPSITQSLSLMLCLLRMPRRLYCFTSTADLRGELLIPQCVPTGRVVLVLKQHDLAEQGEAAPSSTAGAAFGERKHIQMQHVPRNKRTHAVGSITKIVSRSSFIC